MKYLTVARLTTSPVIIWLLMIIKYLSRLIGIGIAVIAMILGVIVFCCLAVCELFIFGISKIRGV